MGDDQRRLVVFDLDACCWYPEMYMLWGGGAPFKQCGTAPNNTLTDVQNTTCRLLGDVAASWAELHRRVSAGEPIVVGIASRSDEPAWARECLQKFMVADGVSMMDVVGEELCEIHKGSKRTHFAALQKRTGIPFEPCASLTTTCPTSATWEALASTVSTRPTASRGFYSTKA